MRDVGDGVDHVMPDASQRYVVYPVKSRHLIQTPETLRKSAENTMNKLVQTCFARLHVLDPVEEELKLQTNVEEADGEIKMSVSTDDAHISIDDAASVSVLEEPPMSAAPRLPCKLISKLRE